MSATTHTSAGGFEPPQMDLGSAFSGELGVNTFREVYLAHNGGVFGMASRICGRVRAADITQEVFLDLWQKPEGFDPARGSLHSLLVTMSHHRAVDAVRSENSRHRREIRTGRDEASSDFIGQRMLDADCKSQIDVALDGLPPNEKEAIVAAFYGRCTYQEAAIVLGLPEGTVKARIRKGLAQLRRTLAQFN
jgi:RNA polymerase sigma factor (sigma-70 family)